MHNDVEGVTENPTKCYLCNEYTRVEIQIWNFTFLYQKQNCVRKYSITTALFLVCISILMHKYTQM